MFQLLASLTTPGLKYSIIHLHTLKSFYKLFCLVFRTPSKQKSPQEEKDIDIVELLRNVDPKEYEKYARMYGITDYRGLLQAIEQLKKEKAEESGRPVTLCFPVLHIQPSVICLCLSTR